MRIGVLEHTDKPGRDRVVNFVSKSTAIKWLTLGTHRPVDKRTIQQIDPVKVGKKLRHQVIEPPMRPIVTDDMRSGEIPGVKTQGVKKQDFHPTLLAGYAFQVRYTGNEATL